MAGKLKSMLENLDHFVDLLTWSHTVYAKDWDVLNVQRARQWGSYFQQVYHRFKANDPIRNAIEDHLAAKNEELKVCFKNYKDITFRDLEKGKAILCMALLHNRAVSTFVFKHLVELLQDSDSEKVDCLGLSHITSQKVASELFLSLPVFVCERSQKPLDDPVLVTQADFLGSSLQRRMKKLDDDQKLSAVSDVLCKLPQPLVYHLIAAVLSNDAVGAENLDHLHDLILEWLLSNDAAWTGFFSNVNHQVLAKLSSRFFKFRQTYLDYLVKLGRGMEQDFTFGMWVSQTPKLSFHEFLEHFRCLLRGPQDLRACTLTTLQMLKCQDGDYEVSGISIWTDILMEINKS
ncbi:PREDICTED: Fanconi anemia group F protein [Nanorana parkeri]|uniref:Fanconi anemia group F protein n=1 Tax=Nanorana parkeri TaxID=125878 RepID=UPI0008549EC5|nr:PREDICTED: Fanconi anemia group F protein [Nanorana parkeri]